MKVNQIYSRNCQSLQHNKGTENFQSLHTPPSPHAGKDPCTNAGIFELDVLFQYQNGILDLLLGNICHLHIPFSVE